MAHSIAYGRQHQFAVLEQYNAEGIWLQIYALCIQKNAVRHQICLRYVATYI